MENSILQHRAGFRCKRPLISSDYGSSFSIPQVTVRSSWMRYLSTEEKRVGVEEFADMLEQTDWFPVDFQRALLKLIGNGKVRNLDAKGKRTKQPLHWKDSERLRLAEEPI